MRVEVALTGAALVEGMADNPHAAGLIDHIGSKANQSAGRNCSCDQ